MKMRKWTIPLLILLMVNCLLADTSKADLQISEKLTATESSKSHKANGGTDLQVVCISRTPRYERICAGYTTYDITEPSGFGPYTFTAATHLCGGQHPQMRHWPEQGEQMTYTAKIRNRGDYLFNGPVTATWQVDGAIVRQITRAVYLDTGENCTFSYVLEWDNLPHDITFTLGVSDERPGNNRLTINTLSVAFLSYLDVSYIEKFRAATPRYPDASTDDAIDWLNRHMARFNELFADANCAKRVHYDVLEVLNDSDPDPPVNRRLFGIFPFRFKGTTCDYRDCSGYYRDEEDIDYGLLHELGHQLGLIDLYRLNFGSDRNHVSGLGYTGPAGLMNACDPFISEHSALAMNHWLNVPHGYYGQYMYCIPRHIKLRLLGYDRGPLEGAAVEVYQYCERPGQGNVMTTQIKAKGTADSTGIFTLPNIPIDPSKVPITWAGDELHDNPFGYLAVIGTNGVLHFRIRYDGGVGHGWLDITQANVAYWKGKTDTAVFDIRTNLRGPVSYSPPRDMAELNAWNWSAWADGSSPERSYVEEDSERKIAGATSIKFTTDGGFDTYVRYPIGYQARWDLTDAKHLNISVYAYNPHIGFQNGSPWIRLGDTEANFVEYQYYKNGSPYTLLSEARNTWKTYKIPLLAGTSTRDGWRRSLHGPCDLSTVQYIEFHADTWDYGFVLWLDDISFDFPDYYYCDFYLDGIVNNKDFSVFASHWHEDDCSVADCEGADIDQNRNVDSTDLAELSKLWMHTKLPRR